MSRNAIEVKNVKKRFSYSRHSNNSLKRAITQIFKPKEKGKDSFFALDGISFNVEKGDFFGILGRNGSGKSTLLKIIAEIYRPTSGQVKHDGKIVSFIELGVGFKGELSGRENVYLNGALLGFSKQEIDEMYDDIVEFAELEKFMDQQLKNYSSGMKVRLAFSVAIRAKADILILDEVLAVGDAEFQRKCFDYFKKLKEDKSQTVIFVTHGMGAVREYCNRAILIEGGEITHQGSADEIADEYLKLFNKSNKMTKATNQKRWGNEQVVIDEFSFNVKKETIKLEFNLKADEKLVEDVVIGFRIKDSNGKVVAGASNLNSQKPQTLSFSRNEKKKISFDMPNILGNGTYSIGATVRLGDGVTICDSWDGMKTFTNSRDEVYYPVLYPANVRIK